MPRERVRPPVFAELVDHEVDAERVYRRALAAFVDVLVADLSAEQAMAVAGTARAHGGVLAFTNGGLSFEVTVAFSEVLTDEQVAVEEERARAKLDAREFRRERKGHSS